jgi:PAS domain-containing protein
VRAALRLHDLPAVGWRESTLEPVHGQEPREDAKPVLNARGARIEFHPGTPRIGRVSSPSDERPDPAALEREVAGLREKVAALGKSEEKYRSVFPTMPVSLLAVDEHGVITEVNPFHIHHIGKGRTCKDDDVGTRITTRTSVVAAGLSERYRGVLEGSALEVKKASFPITTGGAPASSNISGVPLRRKGKVTGALFILEDVTQLKATRDELLRHRAERLIGELQRAAREVRILSGRIPICASCKKIRDDKGFWNQIEVCLREHAAAEFTHGICPECVRKLYPGMHLPEGEREAQ